MSIHPASTEGQEVARLAAELAELRRAIAPDPVPFSRLRAELEALYAPPRRARKSYLRMRQVLAQLEALGVESTADLTPGLVARYVSARERDGASPNNVRALLAYVSAACGWAVRLGWLRVSPFGGRREWVRKTSPARVPAVHAPAAIARVLARGREEVLAKRRHAQAGPWAEWRARRLFAVASVAAYTGMRGSEVMTLRVEDLDFAGGLIHLVARRGRSLKTSAAAQPVPMPAELAATLRAWLPCLEVPAELPAPAGPLPRSNPDRVPDPGWLFPSAGRLGPWLLGHGSPGRRPLDQLVGLGRRAGVDGFTFQSLRHSWATNAALVWGFSPGQIARVLRHTSTRTQAHYLHAQADALRQLGQRVRIS